MRSAIPRGLGPAALLCAAFLIPPPAIAQDTPRLEIGTTAGVTILNASGNTLTEFGVPLGFGPELSPMMYVTIFASPSFIVEPQIGFSRASQDGFSVTSFSLAGQVGYLFRPEEDASPYVAAGGAFQWAKVDGGIFGEASQSGPAFGAELGYRFIVKSALGIRVNGHYRRWFSDYSELNEFGLGVGLGAIL